MIGYKSKKGYLRNNGEIKIKNQMNVPKERHSHIINSFPWYRIAKNIGVLDYILDHEVVVTKTLPTSFLAYTVNHITKFVLFHLYENVSPRYTQIFIYVKSNSGYLIRCGRT